MNRMTLGALCASAMLALSPMAQAHIATISGGYDLNYYDTPELLFNNTSGFDFTSAQMVLTGYQGVNAGKTQTVALGTITAGTILDVGWGYFGTSAGPMFVYDYDDTAPGTHPCPPSPINAGLCGDPGNFYVTFTAIWDGQNIYSQFSPSSNATGGFVPWEGLDASGVSENPCCDVHTGSVTGTLAYIDAGTPPPIPTPEPAAMLVLGSGLLSLGLLRRRRG